VFDKRRIRLVRLARHGSERFGERGRQFGLGREAKIATTADLVCRFLDMLERLAEAEVGPITQQFDGC
jgi:hypothetical protein